MDKKSWKKPFVAIGNFFVKIWKFFVAVFVSVVNFFKRVNWKKPFIAVKDFFKNFNWKKLGKSILHSLLWTLVFAFMITILVCVTISIVYLAALLQWWSLLIAFGIVFIVWVVEFYKSEEFDATPLW